MAAMQTPHAVQVFVVAAVMASATHLASCKKSHPVPVATGADAAAAANAAAPGAEGSSATASGGASSGGGAPVENRPLEKSEELRFVEANGAMLCQERRKKRRLKDPERTVLLKEHGFSGKDGKRRFNELSIRGEKDPEWGRRIGKRIQDEAALVCKAAAE